MKTKILLAIMLVLFMVGCTNNPGTTSQEGNEETTSGQSVMEELKNTVSQKTPEYSVTYSQDMEENGLVDVTLYMKDNKLKMESDSNQGKISFYFLTNEAYMCSYQDKWSCLKISSNDKQETPTETIEYEWEDYENDPSFMITRDGTMSVAGVIAKCYKSDYNGTIQRFCISKEGIPLYNKMEVDGEIVSEFEAKSYSNRVDDSVFELPEGAEIIDMAKVYGVN